MVLTEWSSQRVDIRVLNQKHAKNTREIQITRLLKLRPSSSQNKITFRFKFTFKLTAEHVSHRTKSRQNPKQTNPRWSKSLFFSEMTEFFFHIQFLFIFICCDSSDDAGNNNKIVFFVFLVFFYYLYAVFVFR